MGNTHQVTAVDQAIQLRLLTTAGDLAQVSTIEREVWGYEEIDLMPVTLLVATVKCGALLLGAFDEGRMVGFAYSMPGERLGRRIHWSHLLGVLPAYRVLGVGARLKLEQRRLVARRGFPEIHWTFDPLQAVNAHLNLNKLGAVAAEFVENAYGESTSPLHRGAPTDRLLVHWPTSEASEERLQPRAEDARDLEKIPVVNPVRIEGGWPVCDDAPSIPSGARRLLVCVPDEFTRMLAEAPERALRWRLATRPLFADLLAAGYRGVRFVPLAHRQAGAYVFVRFNHEHRG